MTHNYKYSLRWLGILMAYSEFQNADWFFQLPRESGYEGPYRKKKCWKKERPQ